jgi:hypothetical protein
MYGEIGFNIWDEQEPKNDRVQNLGYVGNPIDMNNAAGAEVRGSVAFSLDGHYDFDYYQAFPSFFRPAFNNVPSSQSVHGSVGVSALVDPDETGCIIINVWDQRGNQIFSGFDFVVGQQAQASYGESLSYLEDADVDFVGSALQPSGSPLVDIDWYFAPAVGAGPYVVGLGGFSMDMNGNFEAIQYTLNWAFG